MEKIVTAMLLMLVKAWTTVDTIGSDFKPNVDKKKYKDSVMECFEKINSYFLKERWVNHKNCGIDRLNPRLNIS